MKFALVPNDDGYGPSALGYYIAKKLLELEHSVIVRNEAALPLNASYYRSEITAGKVSLQPTFGGIRMRKTAEGVHMEGTLQDIRGYPRFSDNYRIPEDVDSVVDIGTPAAARAASVAGKPVFTVFDHSWGKTYEKTIENLIGSVASTLGMTCKAHVVNMTSSVLATPSVIASPVVKAIARIKTDEAKTSAVFLFPHYITPKPFRQHWKSLGATINLIHGVLGGRNIPDRKTARKRMGICEGDQRKTVYMLGGGTPVWDAKLAEIISQLKDRNLDYNVVVFDRKASPNKYVKVGHNVYTGGAVDGETAQGFLPGVDLIVTRAGGGIVNDAIACRVPFVCVEEPNHWQVEMIRENCMHERITRTVPIDEFRTGDIVEIVERELRNEVGNGKIPGNKEIQDKMNGISNGQEDLVVGQIIAQCT